MSLHVMDEKDEIETVQPIGREISVVGFDMNDKHMKRKYISIRKKVDTFKRTRNNIEDDDERLNLGDAFDIGITLYSLSEEPEKIVLSMVNKMFNDIHSRDRKGTNYIQSLEYRIKFNDCMLDRFFSFDDHIYDDLLRQLEWFVREREDLVCIRLKSNFDHIMEHKITGKEIMERGIIEKNPCTVIHDYVTFNKIEHMNQEHIDQDQEPSDIMYESTYWINMSRTGYHDFIESLDHTDDEKTIRAKTFLRSITDNWLISRMMMHEAVYKLCTMSYILAIAGYPEFFTDPIFENILRRNNFWTYFLKGGHLSLAIQSHARYMDSTRNAHISCYQQHNFYNSKIDIERDDIDLWTSIMSNRIMRKMYLSKHNNERMIELGTLSPSLLDRPDDPWEIDDSSDLSDDPLDDISGECFDSSDFSMDSVGM